MGSRYAELAVLTNSAEPHSVQSRYISEQLINCFKACADHCEELTAKLARTPTTSDAELLHYANDRAIFYNYMLNGIHQLRADFDDFPSTPDKDWLIPFVQSMMIWHEDRFRKKIGQPSLFKKKNFNGASHSTFFNLVKNGYPNPLKEWEGKFGPHKDRC